MIATGCRSLLNRATAMCAEALKPADREAILGDLTEEHVGAGETLREILGFLVRREVGLWRHWRPWMALICVGVPFAILLAWSLREIAGWSAVYLWLCANNLDRALLADAGFWHVTADSLGLVVVACATLMFWSWASGCLLGLVARRTAWSAWMVFSFVSLFAISAWAFEVQPVPRSFDGNAIVNANRFYHFVYPLLLDLSCIVMPSLLGVAQGRQLRWPFSTLVENRRPGVV